MALIYQISLYLLSLGVPLSIVWIPNMAVQLTLHITMVLVASSALYDASESIFFKRKTWKLINNPFNENLGLEDLYKSGTLSIVLNITLVILNN